MRKVFQLICVVLLVCGACALAQAGGRISGHNGDALSKAQVTAAGAVALSKAEVEAFIAGHNGRLQGDIGPWKDSLRLFDDKTVKGESRGDFGATVAPGSGSWAVDEDGTFHLTVNWRFGSNQKSSGKLYKHNGYLYQMDEQDEGKSWLYRFKI